jgi:hypothetical protein
MSGTGISILVDIEIKSNKQGSCSKTQVRKWEARKILPSAHLSCWLLLLLSMHGGCRSQLKIVFRGWDVTVGLEEMNITIEIK